MSLIERPSKGCSSVFAVLDLASPSGEMDLGAIEVTDKAEQIPGDLYGSCMKVVSARREVRKEEFWRLMS
jgi:hypothetical protein